MIRRRAYTTRKGIHVKSRLVKDMGEHGKWVSKHGDGIGELNKGELEGYHASEGKTMRRRILRKVVKKVGPLSTFRKLNAIATLTKRTAKGKSKTFKTDRNWVKKTFMKK